MSASPSASEADAPRDQEQITFRFCRECSNMLYPKEDRENNQLMYACRTCPFSEPAVTACVYRNQLTNTVGETAGVTQDVAADPTVGSNLLGALINDDLPDYYRPFLLFDDFDSEAKLEYKFLDSIIEKEGETATKESYSRSNYRKKKVSKTQRQRRHKATKRSKRDYSVATTLTPAMTTRTSVASR